MSPDTRYEHPDVMSQENAALRAHVKELEKELEAERIRHQQDVDIDSDCRRELKLRLAEAEARLAAMQTALEAVEVTTDAETSWVHFRSGSKYASVNIGHSRSQIVIDAITGWVADRLAALGQEVKQEGKMP